MAGPPPLKGIKVLEFAGLAPAPFAGMLLADSGASILRVDRAIPGQTHTSGALPDPTGDILARHKASIAVDLKSPRGIGLIQQLAKHVDVLIDPFRPGVLEKLGLGPDVLHEINPRLIYSRMTGFRRDGKYKDMAGHDINYIAVSGALSLLGRADQKPHAPWNILGDFAGGGATLFQGILLALLTRQTTGKGQVVEANMVDGSSYLFTFPRMALKTRAGTNGPGKNLLDGGCPWYDTYETKDGGYMSVGSLEPQFFSLLIKGLGLSSDWESKRYDVASWPELRALMEGIFKSKTRAQWEEIFDATDACCLPVLSYKELEKDRGREGDQRPPVTLRQTPLLATAEEGVGAKDPSLYGQGSGAKGGGYEPDPLSPSQGGEDVLGEWLGWKKGREYEVDKGGLVVRERARV